MAIGDIDIRLGGAAQQASLLDTLENWKSQNLRKVQEASAQIGEAEAKEDLLSGEGEFQGDFGISNKVYNKTLATGYKESAKTALSEQLSAIATENPNDLQMYNELANEAIKSSIQGADPYIADDLALEADMISSHYRKQVQNNSIKTNMKAAQDEVSRAIQVKADNALGMLANATNDEDIAASALQVTEAINLIDSQEHLNDTQKAVQKEQVAKGFAEQSFLNPILKAETSEDAYSALEGMQDVPKGWSPTEWEKVVNKGFAHANKLAIAEGEILKISEKLAEEEALLTRGSVLFENGLPIDPYKTTESAKYDYSAINEYYDKQYSQEIAGLPANDQINANTAFVQRTGIIPQTLEMQLNAFSRSGDVTQAAVAADQLGRIQETSSQALKDLPSETKAILLQVSDAMKSGANVDLALEAARKSAYGMTEAEKETIKVKAKEYTKDLSSNLSTMLKNDFDVSPFISPFSWAPDAPPGMESEFRIGFENYMVLTSGNSDQASKLAYDDLKRVWGVSEITGGFMKYAPESVYGRKGEDNSWISEQFRMETADYPDATIVVEPATARNPQPEYAIQVPNEQGIFEPLYDENNTPLVWQPDYQETQEFKEFQEQPKNAVEAARKQRELNKIRNLNSKKKIIKAKLRNQDLDTALNNALALGEINEIEAEQLRDYYANQNQE
ncbi:MAG: hypothetical protein GY781_13745 [Gammaproteobacteria bacterium]|nr:hypothetical protein [Gammaproteobacteria bacterium]